MKLIKPILEFLAFLQVLLIIYGVCGAYEQNYIDELQLLKYLLLFCLTLAVNILGIKAMTVATKIKNRDFFKFVYNRPKRLVKLVKKFNHLYKHNTKTLKCQSPKTHRNTL